MIQYRNFYFVFSLLLVSGLLFGQVNPVPSERNITIEEPVILKDSLPKISLPDFVITGQEKINVEGSKKPEFEENRIFSLSDETLTFINKDVSTRATDIPLKKLNDMENIFLFNGFLKAQIGNFTSPNISGGLGYSYDRYFATLYGNYLSRKDHDIKGSGFSTGNVGVTLGANIAETDNIFSDAAIRLNVGYDARSYENFYWAGEAASSYYRNHGIPRQYNSFFINSSIKSDREEYYKYRVNIYFNRYEKFDDIIDKLIFGYQPMQDIEENKFALSLGGEYRYEGIDFSGDILFYNNSYSVNGTRTPSLTTQSLLNSALLALHDIKENSFIFGLFGGGSAELSNNFFATAGFKFYTYTYLYTLTKENNISKGAILPQLSLKYENRNNFSLSLCFNPDLKIMDFQQLYKLNPFATYGEINHSLNPINLFLRFDISAIKNLRILTDVGYLEEKHTPYFYSYDYAGMLAVVIPFRDYYSYLHDDATTKGMYCNLKMEYNIDEFNAVALNFNYQNKKIDSLRVPFVPQISASLNYCLLLDDNKLKISPSVEFIGDRVSPNFNRLEYHWQEGVPFFTEYKEDAVVLVNLDVEYSIIKNLIANLTMTNILNTKYSYYRGYQEYPFSIFAGLKLKW